MYVCGLFTDRCYVTLLLTILIASVDVIGAEKAAISGLIDLFI